LAATGTFGGPNAPRIVFGELQSSVSSGMPEDYPTAHNIETGNRCGGSSQHGCSLFHDPWNTSALADTPIGDRMNPAKDLANVKQIALSNEPLIEHQHSRLTHY